MTSKSPSLGSLWAWLPLLALLPVAFTLLGWRQSARQAEIDIRKELHQNVQGTARSLEGRIQDYEYLLEGARGLLAASKNPGDETWERYVRQVNVNNRFPGLRVVGYAQRMTPGQAAAFTREKQQHDPGYTPIQFEARGERFVITASERYGYRSSLQNQGGVGVLDDGRLETIYQAIDEGRAISSTPLAIEQDNHTKAGTALFMALPWYGESKVGTVEGRRLGVRGLLYATWRAEPMVEEAARRQLRDFPFTIRSADNPQQVLYEDPRWNEITNEAGQCLGFSDRTTIILNGRTWNILACDNREASAMPVYLQAHRWLSLGTVASFLLLGLAYWVLRQRAETLRSAERLQEKHMNLSHRLRDIATRVPVLIAHLDHKGRFLFANELYLQWFGIDPATIEGKRPEDAFGGSLGKRLTHNVERALAGETLREETRIDMRTFDAHYTPETNEAGKVVGAYVVASDITRHKQMERHLSEEKERAEVTLAAIGEAVLSFDPDGRVVYSNPAAEDLLKSDPLALLGRPGQEVLRFLDATGLPLDEHPLDKLLATGGEITHHDLLIEDTKASLVAVEAILSAMKDDDGKMIGGAAVIRDVSQAREMARNLRHMAHHDALTGLPNRLDIHARIDDALGRPGQTGGLVFLDLDHFKNINDTLGHEVGDQVLMEAAVRLRDIVGPMGTVARQGGDEFLILLPSAPPHVIERVAAKLLDAMSRPFIGEHRTLRITASAGVSFFPDPGADRVDLMRQADAAMYAAKRNGRDQVMAFHESMGAYAEERMSIEQGLRNSLTNGDLVLFYQPKIDTLSNTMAGYEALVRWNREGEILPPNTFIPIAEESGLIGEIDLWVMREACRQQARWMNDGLSPMPCAVNVSMARLDAPFLLQCVDEILAETGIPANLLQLEFTETQVMHDGDQVRQLVSALRDRNVLVALDDFGTGYSNLGALNSFGFDTIKIDRSFIQEMSDPKRLSLVRAIISIGRAHGHTIVAEGVETESQASILAREGCHQIQGFLYSKPVDPDKIRTWLTHPFPH